MMLDDENIKNQDTPEVVETATEEVVETATAVEEEVVEEKKVYPKPEENRGPHDEFDWEAGNVNRLPYSDDDIAAYAKVYDATLNALTANELVSGMVTAISSGDVVIDLNYKSDGVISLSEFRDMPDLAVGDPVEVYVEAQEDEKGQL